LTIILYSLPTRVQCTTHSRRFNVLIAVALFVWNNFEQKKTLIEYPAHYPPTTVQDYCRFQLEGETSNGACRPAELFGSFAVRSPDLMRNPNWVGLVAVGYNNESSGPQYANGCVKWFQRWYTRVLRTIRVSISTCHRHFVYSFLNWDALPLVMETLINSATEIEYTDAYIGTVGTEISQNMILCYFH